MKYIISYDSTKSVRIREDGKRYYDTNSFNTFINSLYNQLEWLVEDVQFVNNELIITKVQPKYRADSVDIYEIDSSLLMNKSFMSLFNKFLDDYNSKKDNLKERAKNAVIKDTKGRISKYLANRFVEAFMTNSELPKLEDISKEQIIDRLGNLYEYTSYLDTIEDYTVEEQIRDIISLLEDPTFDMIYDRTDFSEFTFDEVKYKLPTKLANVRKNITGALGTGAAISVISGISTNNELLLLVGGLTGVGLWAFRTLYFNDKVANEQAEGLKNKMSEFAEFLKSNYSIKSKAI